MTEEAPPALVSPALSSTEAGAPTPPPAPVTQMSLPSQHETEIVISLEPSRPLDPPRPGWHLSFWEDMVSHLSAHGYGGSERPKNGQVSSTMTVAAVQVKKKMVDPEHTTLPTKSSVVNSGKVAESPEISEATENEADVPSSAPAPGHPTPASDDGLSTSAATKPSSVTVTHARVLIPAAPLIPQRPSLFLSCSHPKWASLTNEKSILLTEIRPLKSAH